MSDGISPGGAPVPAENTSAPIDTGTQTPNPVSTDNVPERKPEPETKPEPTAREALKRAAEKVDADAKAAPKPVESKPEAKPDAKADAKADPKAEPKETAAEARARAQDGKFAPKEGEPAKTEEGQQAGKSEGAKGEPGEVRAPQRFSTEAKAEWERAHPVIRSEVARMARENEAGIEKYRESAKAFDDIRDFHEQVTKNGGTLRATLSEVAELERVLLTNPVQGINAVCRRLGLDFNQVVESVTGERVGETMRGMTTQMQSLHEENQKLVAIVKSMHREQQERESTEVNGQIEAFKADRPRFDELRGTMAGLINQGLATDLEEAYAMAERLKPGQAAPSPSIPANGSDPAPAPVPSAQTRRGTASIAGAPSPGSNPAARQPASSVKEALRRAAARAG